MTVLITGGAGYIGSHMVLECLDHGEDVVVLDNLVTGFRAAVPDAAAFVEGDIADAVLMADLIATHKVDSIVHFAGSVVVPESFENPLKYYTNNTSKTCSLVDTAVRCGIDKLIFSSTAALYAPPSENVPVTEDSALDPASPYGSSKLMSETMIRDTFDAHDLRYVMLRYFNVAGADPAGRAGLATKGATHVMKLACEAATGKRDGFDILGTDYDTHDGSAVRDFIHVSDLANAHYVALKFLREGGRRFTGNAGYMKASSVRDVVAAVKRASGSDFEVREKPRRYGDVPYMVADPSRLMKRLDWKPRFDDLDTIARDAMAWERKLAATPPGDNRAPRRDTPFGSAQTAKPADEKAAPKIKELAKRVAMKPTCFGLTDRATLV
ncbi:UDP-glucose 4-epimerase GalE [Ahrensia sp. R2A130]|uniref:UDP-glucose 4-epimerase GalE n=1 Tax=Ahrensia sp. R2A130 TaxID=744979 RepID=UPI0001E0CA4F|nr:UDP-glucose 4-epimerase [Ahrensia sp. R2A130]